jgi:hypothetical protein
MKKITLSAVFLLTPLLATAANSWPGYKLVKLNDPSIVNVCLTVATFPSFDGGTYITYDTCNISDQKQHWAFSDGKLLNRHFKAFADYYNYNGGSSFMFLSSTGRNWDFDGYGRLSSTNTVGHFAYIEYRFLNVKKPTVLFERSGLWPDEYRQNTLADATPYLTGTGQVIPNYDSTKQAIIDFTGTMNGAYIGGNFPAKFQKLPHPGSGYITGADYWDAYIETEQHAKVVQLRVEGNRIYAYGAKYRTGKYLPMANDYIDFPLATSDSANGYGIYDVSAKMAKSINAILSTQSELTNKLNTLAFLKTIFTDSTSVATLNVANSFWIGLVDLPKNTSEIPTGSKLLLKRTALWGTSWENKFSLIEGADYVAIYNGKTWDISRDLGSSYLNTTGIALPESITAQSIDLKGTLNGTWMGGAYAAQTDYLGDNKYNLYLETGQYTKVVEVQIVNGVIKAVGAKYREGGYERFATNYINAPLATAAAESGYGVHNAVVTFGTYRPKNLNMGSYANSQDQLTNKINSLPFYKTVFSRPNVLTVSLYDGYWVGNVTLPVNNTLATGSVIKFIRTSGWNTTVNGTELNYGVTYTWTYNGNSWALSQ